MDAIITEFLNSDLCESLGNDPRCPDVIDAVLRNGLPLLAADAKPDDFTQVSLIKSSPYMLHLKYPKVLLQKYSQACNTAKPGTCPARKMTVF